MRDEERGLREQIAREIEVHFSFETYRPGGPKERWLRWTTGVIRHGLDNDPSAQRRYAERYGATEVDRSEGSSDDGEGEARGGHRRG